MKPSRRDLQAGHPPRRKDRGMPIPAWLTLVSRVFAGIGPLGARFSNCPGQ